MPQAATGADAIEALSSLDGLETPSSTGVGEPTLAVSEQSTFVGVLMTTEPKNAITGGSTISFHLRQRVVLFPQTTYDGHRLPAKDQQFWISSP